MAWLLLAGAIVCEVGGTLSLRVAATGRRGWYLLVALTAVGSRLLFDEPLTPLMGAGLALIIVGVLLVELGVHAG